MMLDELEKKAKAGIAGPWPGKGFPEPMMNDNGVWFHQIGKDFTICCSEKGSPNVEFIKAANPQTVLKLVSVVKAAAKLLPYLDTHNMGDELSISLKALEQT